MFIVQLLIGIAGGIAAGLQAPFTGVLGQKVGDLGSVFITYGGGAVLIAIITLIAGGGGLSEWRSVPWYVFLAGPMGLIIIGSLSYTVPRLGTSTATTLFVLSWLIFSAIVDHFGWFGLETRSLDLSRTLGIGALILGTWLVIR